MARKKKKQQNRHVGLIFLILAAVLGLIVWKLVFDRPPCANSISCIKDLSGRYQPDNTGTFLGKTVIPPIYAPDKAFRPVLGETTEEKRIEVDLSTQRLMAYEGNKLIYTFRISSGKWYPTPTGTFRIWVKLRYTPMVGGNQADGTYYNLPNVPYTMFFSNDEITRDRGFALHGAYWHNNFGYPMSHGCVNMRPVDAGKIFDWIDLSSNPGTTVTITGEAPKE